MHAYFSTHELQSHIAKRVADDPEYAKLVEKHVAEAVEKNLPIIVDAEVTGTLKSVVRNAVHHRSEFNDLVSAAVKAALEKPETIKAMEDAALKVFTEDGHIYRAVSYKFQHDMARMASDAIERAARRFNRKAQPAERVVTVKKPKAKAKR